MDTKSWQAEIELEFSYSNRTYLSKNKHSGPLCVQKPFYHGNECHTYLLHPPGGIANNDSLKTDILLHPNTQVLFTTTGASKFYQSVSENNHTEVIQKIKAKENSIVEWLPMENIYFDTSQSQICTEFDLTNSQLIAWEFHYMKPGGKVHINTSTKVVNNDQLLLFERLEFNPQSFQDINSQNQHNVVGNFMITTACQRILDTIRLAIEKRENTPNKTPLFASATLVDGLILVKALGTKVIDLQQLFLSIWQAIRQQVIGITPYTPRIWAT